MRRRDVHACKQEALMTGRLSWPIAVAVMFTLNSGALHAQGHNIFQATLGEAGKTAEINTEQMRALLGDRSAIVLDTRSRAEFDAGHIPGARNLDAAPSAQVAAVEALVAGEKSKALVLYCNGPYCQASRRLAEQLADAGFANVRRYQLGIPVWRALGGPVEIEIGGMTRIFKADRTAVYFDARPAEDFAKGSLPGAISAPAEDVISGKLKKMALPEDDFNRRIILFGADGAQARRLADVMGKRPWHNVSYFPGSYEALAAALK
jgi:rhodanese-related sulfurtransferase